MATEKTKLNVVYYVPDDAWGQHGSYIRTITTTENADTLNAIRPRPTRGVYFDEYIEALYYTQD